MRNTKRSKASGLKKLLADRSIILVSNRGPVEFRRDESGELEVRRGGGGLISAMTAVSEEAQATWISAAMTDTEYSIAQDGSILNFPEEDPLYQIRLIDIPKIIYNRYYNIISNPLLWFVHHYMWNFAEDPSITAEVHRAWHEGYVIANKLFAKAAIEESVKHSSPLIMLQDYHLFVAAKYIREQTSEPFLFHFTHIPWAEPDYLRVLPHEIRLQLMEGMLSNDLIGFQSRNYAHNFLLCCKTMVDCTVNWRKRTVLWQGREIYVRTYPISIDHNNLQRISESPDVLTYESKFIERNQGVSLIVRTDRSDPSKNIVRGFKAYEILLSKHPELREKVKFLALLYPTRENVKEYKDYRNEIEATVDEINQRYKTDNWLPIFLRLEDNYIESVAALKQYDVLLVNPIFDGMNLVSKEGPIINTRNGVLVLSENAGAGAELSNASLVVNPFDVEQTADAMYRALVMPGYEKQMRNDYLKEVVKQNDSSKWLYSQLKDITRLEKKQVVISTR
ncbi:MAG TPA: trehalose-6-phosphate synthase [Anaerolineae bacterium]|nr:trehalose-6-phosphate synthase [Anaerolineae bacterium]